MAFVCTAAFKPFLEKLTIFNPEFAITMSGMLVLAITSSKVNRP
jgi:hypothetical protein